MSLTSQKMIWKLVHMTFGSYVYSLFHFSEFLKQFWAIYEFLWFYSFYFWILVVTCSYESFEGFHARFEIFGILYEQWSKIEVRIEKVGKILDCLKFGTADGPRVRGGQSAVHETCSPEALQRSSQQQNYTAGGQLIIGSSGKLRIHRWFATEQGADGPA